MITFKKIRWKNFLSTGNVFTEVDICKNKTNLIVGDNGAGKSTILDALTFSLFGKPFRKINKPMLINSINEKDCITEIEFSIGNNDYKVVRGIKPNIFEIYCNDQLWNQESTTVDQQKNLEQNILKMNYNHSRKSWCLVLLRLFHSCVCLLLNVVRSSKTSWIFKSSLR